MKPNRVSRLHQTLVLFIGRTYFQEGIKDIFKYIYKWIYLQAFNYYDDIHMNHGSDVTAASSHSSEFEEDRRLKPEVKFILYYNYIYF